MNCILWKINFCTYHQFKYKKNCFGLNFFTFRSSRAEWESLIDENGALFYIESESETVSKATKAPESEFDFSPMELTRRKSIRAGKFMSLIKRKGSSRGSTRTKKLHSSECFNAEKRVLEKNSDFQVICVPFEYYLIKIKIFHEAKKLIDFVLKIFW